MPLGRVIVDGVEAIGGIIDSLHTSDAEKLEAKFKVQELADKPAARQAEITLQEAKHPSPWVAGWRPAVGWTCASGLFFAIVGWPMAVTVARFWGIDLGEQPLNTALLLTILTALLGSSGLRTWEKYKGIARNTMKGSN